MGSRLIKPNDAAWVLIERPDAPVHVAILVIGSPPAGAPPTFLRDVVAGWRACRTFAPPFNYRLRRFPVLSWQELEPDEVDLDYHLRHSALPAPGGERELGVLISRLHSHPLDRNHPLWECHLIEGLEGGRFAMYMKMHHSQVDGVGGLRFFARVLASDPEVTVRPPWAVGMYRPRDEDGPAEERPSSNPARQIVNQIAAVPAMVRVGGGMARQAVFPSEPDTAVPFRAPSTVLNGGIHAPRRFATQHYAMKRIKAVADTAGATVNDVFLAICSGSLRRYLDERDELPKGTLIAGVPVSLRAAGDDGVGTAISLVHARLGTDIADPLDRLDAIHRSMEAAKSRLERLPKAAIESYTLLVMGPYLAQVGLGLGSRTPPMHNIVISNVPGPPDRLYLDGATIDEMYPVSLMFDGQALNISGISYAGEFNLGFTGCRDSLPSVQRTAVYTGEALTELEAALGV